MELAKSTPSVALSEVGGRGLVTIQCPSEDLLSTGGTAMRLGPTGAGWTCG